MQSLLSVTSCRPPFSTPPMRGQEWEGRPCNCCTPPALPDFETADDDASLRCTLKNF